MSLRPVVVKVGGDLLLEAEDRRALAANVRALREAGHPVVILHGGGPQVSRLQERLGLPENKVAGRRITSPEDLVAVQQALCGEVNVAVVTALLAGGVEAFGLHGASGRTIEARRRPPRIISGGGEAPIDFGEVGDVAAIHTRGLNALLEAGFVPVIATLGVSAAGEAFNINADTTSVKLAPALGARALLMATRVGGVFRDLGDPSSRLAALDEAEARRLIAEGVISGGMIPKVEEAMTVFETGVEIIAVVGVDPDDAFLRVLEDEPTVGTAIRP
ncbi:MAG: acetylglutamate kinase [Deltaproteobacteria bacterium]|nr:acetylglutamate kinase [Deltaproteobacteria bacterium]